MKRYLGPSLLALAILLCGGKAFAKGKDNFKWAKDLYRTWKLVEIDTKGGERRNHFQEGLTEKNVIVKIEPSGLVWFGRQEEDLLIDSMTAYEHKGNHYVTLGNLNFKVIRITPDVLELNSTFFFAHNSGITLRFIATDKEFNLLPALHGHWSTFAETDEYYRYGDRRDEFKFHEYFSLEPEGKYKWLEANKVSEGEWVLNGAELTLDGGKGHVKRYLIRKVDRYKVVLSRLADGETVSFIANDESPEDMLAMMLELEKQTEEEEQEEEELNVIYDYPAPVMEPPPLIVKSMDELLADTFKAESYRQYSTSQQLPAGEATLILTPDHQYVLSYKGKTEKGKWKVPDSYNPDVLILERGGIETLVKMASSTSTDREVLTRLVLTLVLPGEKELTTVAFIPPLQKQE